jgi:mannose-1-phosphate guanylyltransferase/mannose-6-phosphate isomerase
LCLAIFEVLAFQTTAGETDGAMSLRIIPAIMSGGAGTRLWPLSTEARPKQFHALGGPRTLFSETLARVSGSTRALTFAAPIILMNAQHTALVREGLGGASATLVLEPTPRNTAAVGAIAAAVAAEIDPDALVLLLPADHLVRDIAAFHEAVQRATAVASERIVTFGITPDRPATGYGYIKRGAAIGDNLFAIETFKEKPDEALARTYLAAGDYLWNAGIFLFSPRVMLAEFGASADIRDAALASLQAAKRGNDEIALDASAFARVRSAPLDIAVMEKTSRAAVAPCDIGWADIGSWDEVWRLAPRDADGFAVLGSAAAADASKMLAAGVKAAVVEGDDLSVIAAPNGLLIVPRTLDKVALAALAAKL